MGRSRRPAVSVRCEADRFSGPGERIIEFGFPGAVADGMMPGGLVSLRQESGGLVVEVYGITGPVEVRVSPWQATVTTFAPTAALTRSAASDAWDSNGEVVEAEIMEDF